ncbi:hypothetical protein B0T21DRAFT_282449, partial [Apiosordaria backusii]
LQQVINLLISAGVKELEGRCQTGRASFAGSDGEGIWHDFDNGETGVGAAAHPLDPLGELPEAD